MELSSHRGSHVHLDARQCPYLDTINRQVIDFDMEKICSVTLSPQNVYACLVCGKFFQGRGNDTPAFLHSLNSDHHIFINLHNCTIYCLPEKYEVVDPSISDIQWCLRPQYSLPDLDDIDGNSSYSRDVFGNQFSPGFIGFNNIGRVDHANVILQLLGHVIPFRNYCLVNNGSDALSLSNSTQLASGQLLALRVSQVIRRIWNRNSLKSVLSPLEAVLAMVAESGSLFSGSDKHDEVGRSLIWMLNTLNNGFTSLDSLNALDGARKRKKKNYDESIISTTFQGRIEVTTMRRDPNDPELWVADDSIVPFLVLELNLPPKPLFSNGLDVTAIPMIEMDSLLEKYDGNHMIDTIHRGVSVRKRFRLLNLPQYLIFHIPRYGKNLYFSEKNTTIVNFPVKNLDMNRFVKRTQSMDDEDDDFRFDLIASISNDSVDASNDHKREDEDVTGIKRSLEARKVHQSLAESTNLHLDPSKFGSHKIQLWHRATDNWLEIRDLIVKEVHPQFLALQETSVLVYERRRRRL